jgi:ATP-binding cassette subfamily C (CFTR/MRP) protein 1
MTPPPPPPPLPPTPPPRYSCYQVAVALFFLYQQMGVSCVAGMAVILVTIPITKQMSLYLKSLQKKLSQIRDERIKITNEVWYIA